MHKYRKQSIIFLMGYLVIFFIILLVALFDINRGAAILEIGMNPILVDIIVIVFSILAMIRVVMEITRIENHSEYEKKLQDFRAGGKSY